MPAQPPDERPRDQQAERAGVTSRHARSAHPDPVVRGLQQNLAAYERGETPRNRVVREFRSPEDEKRVVKEARYCMGLIGRRLRSEFELRTRLAERCRDENDRVDTALVDEVIARLDRADLINDFLFATEWIMQRRAAKQLGTGALRSELEAKGVDESIINIAIDDTEDGSETERCIALVRDRLDRELRSTRALSRDRRSMARRLCAAVQRRGYSQNLALRIVNQELDIARVPWQA
ncbi:regulatory protein RecX [Helcobacillus massiliensis]